jgi:hypothetical protein
LKNISKEKNHTDDDPPILGSWGKIYSLVLLLLILQVILFYLLSKAFD